MHSRRKIAVITVPVRIFDNTEITAVDQLFAVTDKPDLIFIRGIQLRITADDRTLRVTHIVYSVVRNRKPDRRVIDVADAVICGIVHIAPTVLQKRAARPEITVVITACLTGIQHRRSVLPVNKILTYRMTKCAGFAISFRMTGACLLEKRTVYLSVMFVIPCIPDINPVGVKTVHMIILSIPARRLPLFV